MICAVLSLYSLRCRGIGSFEVLDQIGVVDSKRGEGVVSLSLAQHLFDLWLGEQSLNASGDTSS